MNDRGYSPTPYSTSPRGVPQLEFWAEAVGIWVYKGDYHGFDASDLGTPNGVAMINWVTRVFGRAIRPSHPILLPKP